MMRTSQPYPYRATMYDLHINTKVDPPTLHVMRYANEWREFNTSYGRDREAHFICRRWDPIPLSDFIANPFEVVPVEHEFQREEILEWLRKEGYGPQEV